MKSMFDFKFFAAMRRSNSKRQRLEDAESTISGVLGMLLSSWMFELSFAPYCTTTMLAFLLRTCRNMMEPVLFVLTTWKMWPMFDVKQFSQLRRAYVRHLLYDSVGRYEYEVLRCFPSGLTGMTQLTF